MSLNNTFNPKNTDHLSIPNTNIPDTENGDNKKNDPSFECTICLDSPTDPVVSLCGHLFCWPCLHQWLAMKPGNQVCPVCNSAIGKETVVPIYGCENPRQTDPRETIPPRPAGHRTERIKSPTHDSEYSTVDSRSETSSSSSLEDSSIFNLPNFSFGNTPFQMFLGNGFPFGLLPPISDVLDSRASPASTLFSEYMDDFDNSDNEN